MFLDNFEKLFFVSFGAILGANLRYTIFEKLREKHIKKETAILFINNLSCFCLGLTSSKLQDVYLLNASQLGLFISIGFLGSLSTFSTFMNDIFELIIQKRLKEAIKIFIFSVFFSLFLISLGFMVGNK